MRNNIESKKVSDGRRYRARMKVDGRVVTGNWRSTEKEAIVDRDTLRTKAADLPMDVEVVTLRQAFAAVLREARRMQRPAGTLRFYRRRFAVLSPAFGRGFLLRNLTADAVKAYAEARRHGKIEDPRPTADDGKSAHRHKETKYRKKVTRSTIAGDVRALSRAVSLGIEKRWLRSNPVKAAKIPKAETPQVRWFSTEEVTGLLAQMRSTPPTERLDPMRDANIVEFLALTGLRLKEAAQLLVRDVSVARRVVIVRQGKTGSRTLPMNVDLLAVCKRLADHRERFGRRLGEQYLPLNYYGISSMVRGWAGRLGEPRFHPHALRHTFGTALARAGASEQHIKTLMGHKTTHMANRYIHIAGCDLAATMELVSYGSGLKKATAVEE